MKEESNDAVFLHIGRINLLDKLIRQRRTGTPDELGARLGISVSRLYVVLDELKAMGAPIRYSRQLLTYYYDTDYSISIAVNIEELEASQTRHISVVQCFILIFIPLLFLCSGGRYFSIVDQQEQVSEKAW